MPSHLINPTPFLISAMECSLGLDQGKTGISPRGYRTDLCGCGVDSPLLWSPSIVVLLVQSPGPRSAPEVQPYSAHALKGRQGDGALPVPMLLLRPIQF